MGSGSGLKEGLEVVIVEVGVALFLRKTALTDFFAFTICKLLKVRSAMLKATRAATSLKGTQVNDERTLQVSEDPVHASVGARILFSPIDLILLVALVHIALNKKIHQIQK